MSRRDLFVVVAFLAILAFLGFVIRPALHAEDFTAKVKALEARNAAPVKPADPFTAAAKPKKHACPTCGDGCTCTPEDNCGDPNCPSVPVNHGYWYIKAGSLLPAGYRWNAVEGYAFPKKTSAPAPTYYEQPSFFQPAPTFRQTFSGGGCSS